MTIKNLHWLDANQNIPRILVKALLTVSCIIHRDVHVFAYQQVKWIKRQHARRHYRSCLSTHLDSLVYIVIMVLCLQWARTNKLQKLWVYRGKLLHILFMMTQANFVVVQKLRKKIKYKK